MTTISDFISWKEHGETVAAWFDHAAAFNAGVVRRSSYMNSAPCWAPESIDKINGKYHLVEAGSNHETLEQAKAAALESAIEYILDEYRPR